MNALLKFMVHIENVSIGRVFNQNYAICQEKQLYASCCSLKWTHLCQPQPYWTLWLGNG